MSEFYPSPTSHIERPSQRQRAHQNTFANIVYGGPEETSAPRQRKLRETQKDNVAVLIKADDSEAQKATKEERVQRSRIPPSFENYIEKENQVKAVKRRPVTASNVFSQSPETAPPPRRIRTKERNPILQNDDEFASRKPKKVSDINKMSVEKERSPRPHTAAKPRQITFASEGFGEKEQTPKRPMTASRINTESSPDDERRRKLHPFASQSSTRKLFTYNEKLPSRQEEELKYRAELEKTRKMNENFRQQLMDEVANRDGESDLFDPNMKQRRPPTSEQSFMRQQRMAKSEIEFGF